MFISSIKLPETEDKHKLYFGFAAMAFIATGLILQFIQPGIIHTDGGLFGSVAYKDLNGGTMYLDAWENKAPGIFYLLELFLLITPDPVTAMFAAAFSGLFTISLSLFYIFYKSFKSLSLSLLFTPIALLFTIYKNNVGDGLYTEIFGMAFLLLGFALSLSETKTKHSLKLSFILTGMAFWFREPLLLMVIPQLLLIYLIHKDTISNKWIFLFALIPSAFFIALLAINGSLQGFIDMLKYNFFYIANDNVVSYKVKLNELYQNLFYKILPLVFFTVFITYQGFKLKDLKVKILLSLSILLASSALVMASPHNFGHYYFPVFVYFFVYAAFVYGLLQGIGPGLKLPLIILSIYTLYQLDDEQKIRLNFKIIPYQEDKIASFLKQEKGKTLFVDYVTRADYYLKSEKVPVSFVPVALPIHFQNNAYGLKNREKIWKDLSTKTPDYLITTYTTAYFSWFLPETEFYNKHFEKIDSLKKPDEDIIILWRRKNP